MSLPFFYISAYDTAQKHLVLDEDTSRHLVQVLRMKAGELLNLTDGKGNLITCEIVEEHKKHCTVLVKETMYKAQSARSVSVAISLIKNANRFEWFLEKATEIGVSEIIPLICERTEKEKFRQDRMQGIVISAMLQSQQCWLPLLQEPQQFKEFVTASSGNASRFIAHCMEGNKQALSDLLKESCGQINSSSHLLISIGPEGDFTEKEIEQALQQGFIPVTLGETRLRTETAGVVAAALLANVIKTVRSDPSLLL
ncbi:MAG: RsmE family RNA methyltransferase [Bacteroidota bacterium]|nr:RsmE family RNA methyltransferase [Bacteroidota bacterium]